MLLGGHNMHPEKKVVRKRTRKENIAGYKKSDYEGAISTLCIGCGHNSITDCIVRACFELAIEPHRLAKLSGIGCSSKTPAYFMEKSHGFNTVHGRMPAIATGANLANNDLVYLGISGDGDTASIGLGQFVHLLRRNLNMVYIVEDNGCYGLTKGQDSATSDKGSVNHHGHAAPFESIDLANMALQHGATFVARAFSGDKRQLIPILKAAICHKGLAFIDIISPCVVFNNHDDSTKSFAYTRSHVTELPMDFIAAKDAIIVSYKEGATKDVCMHDGSIIRLHKTELNLDIQDRYEAINAIYQHQKLGEILTGILYVDCNSKDLHQTLNTSIKPLNQLTQAELCPETKALNAINKEFS